VGALRSPCITRKEKDMANIIKNSGIWGPIEEGTNTGGFPIRSYEGKQIVLDFDGSEATSIMYTSVLDVPLSTESEIVWNTEATDCATATDMEVFWQGTDDPSVANATISGVDMTAADTGWTSVSVQNFAGSDAADTRTVTNLAGVSSVVNKKYVRFKYILTAATPGDVDVTCRLTGLPAIGKITYSTAL
jgi:hypothetical protein